MDLQTWINWSYSLTWNKVKLYSWPASPEITQCKHSRGVADVMMSQFNTSKMLANVRTRRGAQLQHVSNHNSKFEYKEIKNAGVKIKTSHPHEMCAKWEMHIFNLWTFIMQWLNKVEWKLLELQITQTRHPKCVADGQPDEQTAGWTDRQSGPIIRTAFTKATQVNWAVISDFKECGILTSVDSDEPVQSLLSLETPNDVWLLV